MPNLSRSAQVGSSRSLYNGYVLKAYREEVPDVSGRRLWRIEIDDRTGTLLAHPMLASRWLTQTQAERYAERIVRDHSAAVGAAIASRQRPAWELL
ncbi:MAG: hypothetical protein ACJ746_13710 [Bryobacteraceae bacterium]